jgi:glycerophosphoryl diester phosphodiesterase
MLLPANYTGKKHMRTRIIGHRGARGEAPENTLSGFKHLVSIGIRAVEFDIRVSADHELVVIHDDRLERTSNGTGLVSDHTHDQLNALNACQKSWPDWPTHDGVPTLDQVLCELNDFEHIELEVKQASQQHYAIIIKKLSHLWQQHQLAGRAKTTSFDSAFLSQIANELPYIDRGFLFEANFQGDAIAIAKSLNCKSIGPNQLRCDAHFIELAHAHGLYVSTWTVNQAERAAELMRHGVDAIITDLPSQARAWARQS